MIFLIKKRKLVLDLFTCRQTVFDTAKPKSAANFFPEWWMELKTEIPNSPVLFPQPTMRRCMGLVDHYKQGFIVPMWSDFRIEVGEIGTQYHSAQMSDQRTVVAQHPPAQRGSFAPPEKYCHIKFETPWLAKSKEVVYFKWEQPTWNMSQLNTYTVLPATSEFKYQYSMNAHMMFMRTNQKELRVLNFGTPLLHLTPLTERKLELRHHLVTIEEYERLLIGNRISFLNMYRTTRRAMEEEEKRND